MDLGYEALQLDQCVDNISIPTPYSHNGQTISSGVMIEYDQPYLALNEISSEVQVKKTIRDRI